MHLGSGFRVVNLWFSTSFGRSFTVVRIFICALLLGFEAIVSGPGDLARAQERPTDLTELTLEELMEVNVISIDVLGTHTHLAGQWMLTYKYMFMWMDGNRDGTDRISHRKVHEKFDMAPTEMAMEMHMPMVMYAPTDDLTLHAMLPYIRKSMKHITRDGVRFSERTEGIGDLKVEALYTLYGNVRRGTHRFILDAGLSFPTGSIDKKDFGPDRSMGRFRLEYPMQLGSGTFDLYPGITYLGQTENWAWGAEIIPTIRVGKNNHGYRLGNQYYFGARLVHKLTDWLSTSVRVNGQVWENIHGSDRALNPAEEPSKDPNKQGGRRVDLLLGINVYVPKGVLKGQRLAIEGGFPIYQSLDGPQLETRWQLTVGWQWVF
jgi:hypothetical protein